MNNKTIRELMKDIQELREKLTAHLIESGGIKTQLAVNTWLTGGILFALVAQFLKEYFKR